MQAIVCQEFNEPETLKVLTLPDPTPGPGEVVLRVQAASVNYPDALMVQGKYQVRPALPFTPGAEAAGEIVALGEGVTGLKVGQMVAALSQTGAFATHLKVPASTVFPVPPGLSAEVACTLPLAYGTVLHALLQRGQVKEGDTLLVLGAAGGVGLAAVMIGKALGAKVIAATSTPEKGQIALERGADNVILYDTEDLRTRLKELTDGKGPDVIFDPVGDKYAEPAFRSIAWEGRYLVVGFAAGEIPRLPLNLALLKGASLVGVFWGEFARRDPKENARNMAKLIAWISEDKVRPLVSERYPLEKGADALRALLERRVTGKIVIVP